MANKEIVWYNATAEYLMDEKGMDLKTVIYILDCALNNSKAYLCHTGPNARCAVFKPKGTRLAGGNSTMNYLHYVAPQTVTNSTKYYRKCVKDSNLQIIGSKINSAINSNTTLSKVLQKIGTIINEIILPVMSTYLKGSFKLLIRLPQQLNNLPTPIKFTMFSFYIYFKRERILNLIKQGKDIFNSKGIDINQNEEYLTSRDI
jgi:hypothetical protein